MDLRQQAARLQIASSARLPSVVSCESQGITCRVEVFFVRQAGWVMQAKATGSLVEDAHPDGSEDYEDASLDDGLIGNHHTACSPT